MTGSTGRRTIPTASRRPSFPDGRHYVRPPLPSAHPRLLVRQPAEDHAAADGPDGEADEWDKTRVIGDQFNGAPKAENLFTGFDRMNKSGMRRCEKKTET
ncbi:hypothetical protein ACFWPQ_30255 [Streptomyces sp. NPDC058464]|uniref:hypothetical protein n=1 Tax=Streptomyces sp. NPDC058464 TaxID=3346511 RepID=UPI003649E5EA